MHIVRTSDEDAHDRDDPGAGASDAPPSSAFPRPVGDPPEGSAAAATTIPGTPEQAARSVEAVSVEGRPGDAKSGPRTLWIQLAVAAAIIVAGATAVGFWFGAVGGLAAFFLGVLALLANPEIGASMMRTRDRTSAIERLNRRPRVHDRSGSAR